MLDLSYLSFANLLTLRNRLLSDHEDAPQEKRDAILQRLFNVEDAIKAKPPETPTEVVQKMLGMVRGDESDEAMLTLINQAQQVLVQAEGMSS